MIFFSKFLFQLAIVSSQAVYGAYTVVYTTEVNKQKYDIDNINIIKTILKRNDTDTRLRVRRHGEICRIETGIPMTQIYYLFGK